MEFKRIRKGIYEGMERWGIERHYYGGKKMWYVYKNGAMMEMFCTMENAKRYISKMMKEGA